MGKVTYISILLCVALIGVAAGECYAQKYPERRLVRQGNKDYGQGRYAESEIDYRRALEKTPGMSEAGFNLGNALYKQQRFEEADKAFSELGGGADKAQVHYNRGNALFQQGKLEEALEQYKESLRHNPDDQQAKFNLAYVKKLLEKEDENQQDNQDNQDQEQNQDDQDQQDQQQDQDQDQQDDNNEQDKDKGDEDQGQEPPPAKQQPQQSNMTREEAEQLLEVMQQNEDKTREKVDAQKVQAVGASGKNW